MFRKPSLGRNSPYRRWLFEGLLLLGALVALHAYQTRNLVQGVAPDFSAPLLDGSPVQLSGFRGQPVLLQFWASWCPVCRLEVGSLDGIARDHAVLSVALEETSPEDIQQWLKQHAADFPVVRDLDGRIASLYGVRGVPTSIIIDAAGNIRFVEVGYTTETGLRLRLWWVEKFNADRDAG